MVIFSPLFWQRGIDSKIGLPLPKEISILDGDSDVVVEVLLNLMNL